MSVTIRLADASDVAAVAAIYRPFVESTVISFEYEPPADDEMRRRMDATMPSYPWLVCDIDGAVAGYAYAGKHSVRAAYQWSVDTSVYVHTDYHRRGIGRGLYLSLFGILIAQGYFNAYAGITLPNAASVGLHERVGFEPVGVYRNVGHKFGHWHDVGWWQLALKPRDASPQPPVSVPEVQRRKGWDDLLSKGTSAVRAGAAGAS